MFAGYAGVFLLCALIFGGSVHGADVSTAVVRLMSLPLVGLSIWRLAKSPAPRLWPFLIATAVLAIPVVQLIPMGPSLWSTLPGRGFLLDDFRAAGIAAPWMPLSLAPSETRDALLSLIPPLAIFLAAFSLSATQRRQLLLSIPVFASFAVALGMMQVLGGQYSSLRPYSVTNTDSAVGFFANRNHQAVLLVVASALAPQWATAFSARRDGLRSSGLYIALALLVLLVVGVGVTRSRAGVLLEGPALVLGLLAMPRPTSGRSNWGPLAALGASVLAAAGLIFLFASDELAVRFQSSLTGDLRIEVIPTVEVAIARFWPFGSGLGSFDKIYQLFEGDRTLRYAFINHAHNDYLEMALEIGLLAPLVVLGFFSWWSWRTWKWFRSRNAIPWATEASASLVIAILLVHSVVDYPLRTAALDTLFALCCGILASAAPLRTRPAFFIGSMRMGA